MYTALDERAALGRLISKTDYTEALAELTADTLCVSSTIFFFVYSLCVDELNRAATELVKRRNLHTKSAF